MTREQLIDAAVRKWWHCFDLRMAERTARMYGVKSAMKQQGLFIRLVRNSFKEMAAKQ